MVSYENRLVVLELTTVLNRLTGNDLCFAHSVHSGRHRCDALSLVTRDHSYPTSRAHCFRVERARKGPRIRCPANRIASRWNRLSDAVVRLKKKAFSVRVRKMIDEGKLNLA